MDNLKLRVYCENWEDYEYCDTPGMVYSDDLNVMEYDKFDEIFADPDKKVMLCSGIEDRSREKLIYAGDIVQVPNDYNTYGMCAGEIYEVYFAFGGFRLKPKYRKKAKGFYLEDDGELEILGNIYENPELLENLNEK